MMKLINICSLCLFCFFISIINTNAGLFISETDGGDNQLVGFFDLRDRESFIQITNINSANATIHIQLFDVGNNCNENNFFEIYTPNDTHVYNLRDIVTNDGNPSGVVLPDNAYGIIVATSFGSGAAIIIGNLRIDDTNGYEYRTNLVGTDAEEFSIEGPDVLTFNYNTKGGVVLSDIFGITLDNLARTGLTNNAVFAADIINIWYSFDIDIYDVNEVPFSCRNVIFACTDQNNPLLEGLLEESGNASIASFEYGINNSIPNSKEAPLLCPNNTISEGIVRMSLIGNGFDTSDQFIFFIGLNNGNGRGSLDSYFAQSGVIEQGS